MFLQMQSKKARELLAKGLNKKFDSAVTRILVDLNTVKKGFADIDYDYEKVLGGIKSINELYEIQAFNANITVLLYCILALLLHQEFSVREYSLHALTKMLPSFDEKLFKKTESFLIQNLKQIKDEMTMKTILLALRHLVVQSEHVTFLCASKDLKPLINETHEDFFTQIMSMQLP
jgi:hypothetical protein